MGVHALIHSTLLKFNGNVTNYKQRSCSDISIILHTKSVSISIWKNKSRTLIFLIIFLNIMWTKEYYASTNAMMNMMIYVNYLTCLRLIYASVSFFQFTSRCVYKIIYMYPITNSNASSLCYTQFNRNGNLLSGIDFSRKT